ncbi:hypothetical protein KMZ93_14625 [Bradyrhizobium sediminis]|uniref:Uncharacterized protein n=1 Tax=Bradyrhizobium sediminis TaxID=2840469 RepID=A0A975NWF7_9BRAD|nr:hypothetical protein [Bradyrhizobium sediminis]QWG21274.1 hypothetical protein KMZ93_14625 [Bradyrhizobium sediminis]
MVTIPAQIAARWRSSPARSRRGPDWRIALLAGVLVATFGSAGAAADDKSELVGTMSRADRVLAETAALMEIARKEAAIKDEQQRKENDRKYRELNEWMAKKAIEADIRLLTKQPPPIEESAAMIRMDMEIERAKKKPMTVAEARAATVENAIHLEIQMKSKLLWDTRQVVARIQEEIGTEKNPLKVRLLEKQLERQTAAAEALLRWFYGPEWKYGTADKPGPDQRPGRPTVEQISGHASGILKQSDAYDRQLRIVRETVNIKDIMRDATNAFGSGRAGPGGVSLHLAAEVEPPLDPGAIKGAEIAGGRLYLNYGNERLAFPDLPLDFLALAIRSIYGGEGIVGGKLIADEPAALVIDTGRDRYGELVWNKEFLPSPRPRPRDSGQMDMMLGPAIGLMAAPEPSMQRVLYYGPIADTRLGNVLLAADRVILELIQGVDSASGKPLQPIAIENYRSSLEYEARAALGGTSERIRPVRRARPAAPEKWWLDSTFLTWIPEKVVLTRTGDALSFGPVRMKLAIWSADGQNDSLDPYNLWLGEFSSRHYDELAVRFPVLNDLKTAAQTVAVIRWLKNHRVSLDTSWADHYSLSLDPVRSPATVRLPHVELMKNPDGTPMMQRAATGR